jgi:transposase-like protein
VGLKNIDDLILELLPYGSSTLRARLGQNGATVSPTGKRRGRPPRKSRGTRYTADVKAAVKRAVEEGGKTVAEISRELGPSVFSIKDWKKQWGLTRARKKK